jgi:hypothetical protein
MLSYLYSVEMNKLIGQVVEDLFNKITEVYSLNIEMRMTVNALFYYQIYIIISVNLWRFIKKTQNIQSRWLLIFSHFSVSMAIDSLVHIDSLIRFKVALFGPDTKIENGPVTFGVDVVTTNI